MLPPLKSVTFSAANIINITTTTAFIIDIIITR